MFKFCPVCQSEAIEFDDLKKYSCRHCGWVYYQNPAAAVMCVLTLNHKILFARRAKDPAMGKLDCPGGFVDPNENAEEALHRELYEELKIRNLELKYLGTATNSYVYKNITYPTCDIIFTAPLLTMPEWFEVSEISELVLLGPDEINPDEIGFPSVKKALSLMASAQSLTPNSTR